MANAGRLQSGLLAPPWHAVAGPGRPTLESYSSVACATCVCDRHHWPAAGSTLRCGYPPLSAGRNGYAKTSGGANRAALRVGANPRGDDPVSL